MPLPASSNALSDCSATGTTSDWRDRALCAEIDPAAFFPEKGESTRDARAVCTACTVQRECLDFALAHDERFGVWGGLSERERRRMAVRARRT